MGRPGRPRKYPLPEAPKRAEPPATPPPRTDMAPSLAVNQGRLGTQEPLPPPPAPPVYVPPPPPPAPVAPKRKPSTHPLVVAMRDYIGGEDAEACAINILMRTADAARYNCSMPSDQVAALIRAQAEIEEEEASR